MILDGGNIVKTNFVVSNADATQTFKKLLNNTPCRENKLVDKLTCFSSLFALYIGTDMDISVLTNEICNIWSFDSHKIDSYISKLKEHILNFLLPLIMTRFPSAHASDLEIKDKNTIQFFIIAPFESESFWYRYKKEIAKK